MARACAWGGCEAATNLCCDRRRSRWRLGWAPGVAAMVSSTQEGGRLFLTCACPRAQIVMKNIIPVVMAGVLGIYGLIIAVIISNNIVAVVGPSVIYPPPPPLTASAPAICSLEVCA
jgi:F0F1-type ATP synthase membrane subunit c/vacuolar-type H+-ATPase subunit K